MTDVINKIWLFFGFTSGGNARSNKIKRNILASFFVKGGSIVIGFLMVPLCLNYLDQTRYGIWLTMSSFLGWFSFFEIGLGAGLRNKLAESLAIKDFEKGKIYVSTTYAILSIVIIIVALIFLIANQLLDWTRILNTDQSLYSELRILALIVFNFFFLRFVLKLIGIILYADQRPALANLGPTANLISLLTSKCTNIPNYTFIKKLSLCVPCVLCERKMAGDKRLKRKNWQDHGVVHALHECPVSRPQFCE